MGVDSYKELTKLADAFDKAIKSDGETYEIVKTCKGTFKFKKLMNKKDTVMITLEED
jgi:hypothetical protein